MLFKSKSLPALVFSSAGLMMSGNALATYTGSITVLNHNFEYDLIPYYQTETTSIGGWLSVGSGQAGVTVPKSSDVQYASIAGKAQVAYLNEGGRISQATKATLVEGETYTMTFDVGWPNDQIGQNVVARIRANGTQLIQQHSDSFSTPKGNWSTESISFVATSNMPLGGNVAVEFDNLATTPNHQVHIDNVKLTVAGTGTTSAIDTTIGSLELVKENITLNVPGSYANINAALSSLDSKRILDGKKATIQVTNCTNQTYTQPIDIYHTDGHAIEIIGNTVSPANCVLQFYGTSGIVVSDGSHLGKIDGFTIKGNHTANTNGLHTYYDGYLTTGSNLVVSHFDNGVVAEKKSSIMANGITVQNNLNYGLYSYANGYIAANGATANMNVNGIVAEGGSIIEANNAAVFTNTQNGIKALNNAFIYANNSSSNSNIESGYHAHGASVIEATGANATNNNTGYLATNMSIIDIKESTNSGNIVSHSPTINTTEDNYRSVLIK